MKNCNDHGRLIIVGTGIRSIAQLTLETVAWIKAADVVCYVVADPVTERWIVDNAKAAEDLSVFYSEATSRLSTYANMAERLVHHARQGRTVVGAFYGHPGVFTSPSHWAIAAARAEGISAQMLPGISAEDCLFADLAIDPSTASCQTFEATEMMLRGRRPDPDAHVIIWQIGVLAQPGYDHRHGRSDLGAFVEYLCAIYPKNHQITHYQAAQTVLCDPVIEQVALIDLANVPATVASTLYIPPAQQRAYDMGWAQRLKLDESGAGGEAPGTVEDVRKLANADPGDSLPSPDWYAPLSSDAGSLYSLVSALSLDPSLLYAFRADPGIFLWAAGLDMIEAWATLAKNPAWINQCVQRGGGPAAAVALGAAQTEDEARSFVVTPDGRLMKRRRQPPG